MNANANAIPSGFSALSGDYPETHRFEDDPIIIGTWIGSRDAEITQGGRKVTRLVATVELESGERRSVWESAGLKGLFDSVAPGDQVYIRFDGMGTPKPGMNAPKLFTTAIKKSDIPF